MPNTRTKPPPPGSAVYELTDLEGDTYIVEQDYLREGRPGEIANFNIRLWSKEKTNIQGSSLPHSQVLPLDFQFTIEVQGEGELQSTSGGQASEWTHIAFLLPNQPDKTTTIKIAIVLEQKGGFKTLPVPIYCVAKSVNRTKRRQTSTQQQKPRTHDKTRMLYNIPQGKKSLTKEDVMASIKTHKALLIVLLVWVVLVVLTVGGIGYLIHSTYFSVPIPKKVICDEEASAERTPDGKHILFKDCELEF
ncbi:hypothetical protein KJ969_02975 [Patescibacteria group bacterium]|nr:hypothetical protein [Patescibacteria group bacterium]MBU1921951.1 hypothetical protein [Patescibacteria group bacterium]